MKQFRRTVARQLRLLATRIEPRTYGAGGRGIQFSTGEYIVIRDNGMFSYSPKASDFAS